MRTRFLIAAVLAAQAASAQHPRLILNSTRLATMRAKVASNEWTWSDPTFGLKAYCDGLVNQPVWPLRSLDERYSVDTPYARLNSSGISAGYQGYGYDHAVEGLGACYQANLTVNTALATVYGEKLAAVASALGVTPGKAVNPREISSVDRGTATTFHYMGSSLAAREIVEISGATGDWAKLNGVWNAEQITSSTFQLMLDSSQYSGSFNGLVSLVDYISDSSWQQGTVWQHGMRVSGNQNNSNRLVLNGGKALGTVVAGDAFVVAHAGRQYVFVAAATGAANASGSVTVFLCPDCTTNQVTGAYLNMQYPAGGFSDGDAVTREVVILSGIHGRSTGDVLTISGVAGNAAANGTFTVTSLDRDHLLLQGTTMGATPQTNLIWDAGVNNGYGSRAFTPAVAYAYDWGFDLLPESQKAGLRAQMTVWRTMGYKLNDVAFGRYGGHPMGNYYEGTVGPMFLAALAPEPEDPFQTSIYKNLRAVFWDSVGYSDGSSWYPSGIADYYSNMAKDFYYGDGPFYGNQGVAAVLATLFSMQTAKAYDAAADPHPFQWAPGQYYLYSALSDRTTSGLRTSLNSSNGGGVADRSAHRMSGWAAAIIQEYLKTSGDPFAPYWTSYLADYFAQAKTLPYPSATWPWTGQDRAWVFVYYDSSAPAMDYKTLPNAYVSQKQPELLWRNDWSATGDWFSFNSSHRVNAGGSEKYSNDAGALYIARPAGNLLTNPIMEYFKFGNIAFDYEAMVGTLPRFANVFQVGSTVRPYVQIGNGPGYYGYDPRGCHSVTTALATDIQQAYIYGAGSGLEKMYANAAAGQDPCSEGAVSHWSRRVFHLRNANQTTIVHDITAISNPAWDQMMVWSFGAPGAQSAAPAGMRRFDIGPGGAATAYLGAAYSILPGGHTTKFGDPRDGTTFSAAISPSFASNVTSRLEIRPPGATAGATWMSMFDLAPNSGAAYVPTLLTSSNADAIQLNDGSASVVAFARTATPTLPMTYVFQGGSTAHYICGLVPNTTYHVSRSGHTIVVSAAQGDGDMVSSSAGVISFVFELSPTRLKGRGGSAGVAVIR